MTRRVLVTGASGFVGRQTIAPLLERGWEVHAVGSRVTDPGARWYRCDLLDAGQRRRLLAMVRPEALLHAAWVTAHQAFWTAPQNLDWTAASLELLRDAAALGLRRVLITGSCAEYDWQAPPLRPWREDDRTRPATLYGAAKHALHSLAAPFLEAQGVGLVWARLFHLFGPHEPAGRLVPSLLAAAAAGREVRTGPAGLLRDLLDVRDAGQALALLLDSAASGAVNVGAGGGIAIGELARRVGALTGRPELLIVGGRPGAAGEPEAIIADTTRLRQAGFVPRHRLDATLAEIWTGLGGVVRPIPAPMSTLDADDRYETAARLYRADRTEEAEQAALALLAMRPGHPAALNLLGVLLRRRGQLGEAQALLEQATQRDPDAPAAWVNLGNLYIELERAADAVACYRRAAAAEPAPERLRLIGVALARDHRHAAARAALAEALAAGAEPSAVQADLARAWFAEGDAEAALACLRDAEAPDLLCLRADILRLSGHAKAALAVLEAVLARDPTHRGALLAMAEALLAVEDRAAANAHYRRALALAPDDENVLGRLCWSLLNSRHGDEGAHVGEAAAIARAMVEAGTLRPGSAHAVQSALMRVADFEALARFDRHFGGAEPLLGYWVRRNVIGALHARLARVESTEDRLRLVDWHRAWGDALEARHTPLRPSRSRPHGARLHGARLHGARLHGARLRVGIMSSDLRNHPVSYFAGPIFEHYDREEIELFAYSFNPAPPDPVQARIAASVSRFDMLHSLPDEAVAARIADDRLDVLFELGGSTHLNRLEVMAYQPAPVQVSWLGYPHSAGLSRIGHILVDPYVRPADPRLLIERPFEMPASWVCLGDIGFPEHPITDGLPEARAGRITFGTMNNPYKYTPAMVALWARAMQGVAGSRLLFVRPECGATAFRELVAAQFAGHGIARDRLAFRAVRGDHMRHYNDIDISLDTLPQTGGTTTCECLWMGVPVISLTGPCFFERLSTSTLVNAGLGDFAVPDPETYVARALDVARDAGLRRELRRGLRETMRASALGDQRGWVRAFEDRIRAVT